MKIPVFVSCPSALNPAQEACRRIITHQLDRFDLEPRALGRSDYPTLLPMREVLVLAQHCSGGVILGFEQFQAKGGIWKRGAKQQKAARSPVPFPTPWNHLEAGMLFALRVPLLVFRENGLEGGIFDPGVTDVFIHRMPKPGMPRAEQNAVAKVFLKWQSDVRAHYYG